MEKEKNTIIDEKLDSIIKLLKKKKKNKKQKKNKKKDIEICFLDEMAFVWVK